METNKDIVIIMKNPGTTCNIGCVYCAEARKTEIIENRVEIKDIKKIIDLCRSEDYVTILFHGGEPTLLPISYYEEIITYCKENLKDVAFGLQTNAVLLDDEWIAFLKRHQKYVGISVSLDGSEEMSRYRKKKNNDYAYKDIVKGIRLLEINGIQTGMISTLTTMALGRERELIEIIKSFNNIRFLKINPCYDIWDDGEIPEWGITPVQYATFVCNFFDLMIHEKIFGKINIEPILSIIKNIENLATSYCNYSSNKCSNFISLYPNGVVTSCDNFGVTEGNVGNIYSLEEGDTIRELLNFKYNQPLNKILDELLNDCELCDIKKICKGGCLAARKRYTRNYAKNYDIYCDEMKRMINYIQSTINKFGGK